MVKSDYLTDILERTPIWIIRWGNTLFLLFIISLLVLCVYIKYPDIIDARLELVTQNPPIEVNALVDGKIDSLGVEHQSLVKKDQILARINSIASHEDIIKLEKKVAECLEVENISAYKQIQFPERLQLGFLGRDYNVLQKEFTNLKYFLQSDFTFKKISSIETEIEKNISLNQYLEKQEEINLQEVNLTRSLFERNKAVHKEGLISDEDIETIERDLLRVDRAFENTRIRKIENELQIERLQMQKVELLNDRSLELNSQLQRIKELLNEIQDRISEWKENHLIKAPIAGIISYDPLLSQESPVKAGTVLFNIIPQQKNNQIIGICKMPILNSGEIKKGNLAQVRLDAFPYQEYGILDAVITSISVISKTDENNQTYNQVELSFGDSLKTTLGKEIVFTQKMTGSALIIKEKKSLFDRVFDQIISLFK